MINHEKIYYLLRQIPKGKVSTYKEVAQAAGTNAYRGIGQIIKNNPNAPQTPCHRVVKSDGSISGYAFGVNKKIALLESENVKIKDGFVVDFKNKLFKF